MGKVSCGLCSLGMSGRVFHGPLIDAHPGFVLKAVLERTKNEASKFYPDIKTYRKYEDLLNDTEIELLVVNVPDHLHHPFSKQALEAGKHLVVEKPFTMTVEEGEDIIKLAEKKNLNVFVYQNRRWDSDFLAVKKVLESGQLGRVVEFEAHYDRFRPDPPIGTWKEDEKLGPGLLYNLGAHLIDQVLVLFGQPKSIYAEIRKLRKNTGIVDFFTLNLYYPEMTATLKSSYLVKKAPAKYILHGDKGSFIKSGMDPQEERLNKGWKADAADIGLEPKEYWGKIFTDQTGQEGELIISPKGNYMKFYDGVFAGLNGKKDAGVNAGQGLDVIRIIEAAIESNKLGKRIHFESLK